MKNRSICILNVWLDTLVYKCSRQSPDQDFTPIYPISQQCMKKELFSVSHSPTEASPCLLDSLKGKNPHSFMWYSNFHLLPEPWKLEVIDRTQALRHWCGAVFCRLNGQTCQRLFMTESILSTFSAFLIIVKTSPISISWNGKFSTASLANVQKKIKVLVAVSK